MLEPGKQDLRCSSFNSADLLLKDGSKVFSGGADNAGRMFDVATGQATQIAQHDAPIKVVRWIESPQSGILATGSWDKTIKVRDTLPIWYETQTILSRQYWDLRSSAPIATVQLPERCYSMDVQYPLMVVGTAERHIQIYNLTNPTALFKVCFQPEYHSTTDADSSLCNRR